MDVEMKESKSNVSSKQKQLDYLRQFRLSMQAPGVVPQQPMGGQEPVNEDLIVRDLLFVFQGIGG